MSGPWICPKCGRVYGPGVPECHTCNAKADEKPWAPALPNDIRPTKPRKLPPSPWDREKYWLRHCEYGDSNKVGNPIPSNPVFCEHNKECPRVCPCPPDCYCKTHTCKDNPRSSWVGTN